MESFTSNIAFIGLFFVVQGDFVWISYLREALSPIGVVGGGIVGQANPSNLQFIVILGAKIRIRSLNSAVGVFIRKKSRCGWWKLYRKIIFKDNSGEWLHKSQFFVMKNDKSIFPSRCLKKSKPGDDAIFWWGWGV